MNAACSLMIADKVPDLKAGVDMAADAIDSGKASATLERLVAVSNRGKSSG